MSAAISERTRTYLSQSLPLMQQHKEHLINRMEANLRADVFDDPPWGRSEETAMILVDLLLDQVRCLCESGELGDMRAVIDDHRALAISGRHYSRFGDALVPVIRDLLGPRPPSGITSAWSDAFWTVIRAAFDEKERDFIPTGGRHEGGQLRLGEV
jgi:hemoglobin-like flavoprotein